MNEFWNFSVWKAFNRKLYSECLTAEDITDGGIEEFHETLLRIDEVTGLSQEFSTDIREHLICIKLEKAKKKYLMPIMYQKEMPLAPLHTFKCQIKKADKKIYNFIESISSKSISKDKGGKSFKQFIEEWNPVAHSNPKYWTFARIFAISTKYKGVKACICSEPMFGKNANFSLMNYISQDVSRIQKPTLAKLETTCFYNQVVLPDEVTSMKNTDVKEVEPMILWLGDNSTEYNKHSIARIKELNTVDLMRLSFVFTYNRPQDLTEGSIFFDKIWTGIAAFKSRYPQLLFKGKVLETMPNLSMAQAKEVMEKHFEEMRKVARAYSYWTNNLHLEMHGWDRMLVRGLNPRHRANLEAFIDAIDVYSESQEEFDDWIKLLYESLEGYRMLTSSAGDLNTYSNPSFNPVVEEQVR